MGETAFCVLSKSQTIQGWRPNSAVHQPASVASSVKKIVVTSVHKTQRVVKIRRPQK